MNSIIVLLFIQNISKFFLLEVFLQSIVPRHSFGTKKIFFIFCRYSPQKVVTSTEQYFLCVF